MDRLYSYLPQDRRLFLSRGESLSEHTHGSALFADIQGFTPLTEKLTQELGPRRGVEELIQRIDEVYAALIAEVERYGGNVISFAGDAITCWFDDAHEGTSASLRASACAMSLPVMVARNSSS